jgi:hypothetical protein
MKPHPMPGPVIIFAYAHAGAARLQRLLSRSPVLACTSGTGLLPLCDQAAAAWRKADNRDDILSPLAIGSIRALASSLITTFLAAAGGARWCEVSFSPPGCAETFLQLYPATKFVCLHRNCLDVIEAGIRANPWSLAGTAFSQFTVAYPGNSAAAIAAYWASCTESLLRFEQAHPDACHRTRYEDLASDREQDAGKILAFLNLAQDPSASLYDTTPAAEEPGITGHEAEIPAGLIPPPLKAQVNDLHTRIGYPPSLLTPAGYPGDHPRPA